jgi:hypothetical protein
MKIPLKRGSTVQGFRTKTFSLYCRLYLYPKPPSLLSPGTIFWHASTRFGYKGDPDLAGKSTSRVQWWTSFFPNLKTHPKGSRTMRTEPLAILTCRGPPTLGGARAAVPANEVAPAIQKADVPTPGLTMLSPSKATAPMIEEPALALGLSPLQLPPPMAATSGPDLPRIVATDIGGVPLGADAGGPTPTPTPAPVRQVVRLQKLVRPSFRKEAKSWHLPTDRKIRFSFGVVLQVSLSRGRGGGGN